MKSLIRPAIQKVKAYSSARDEFTSDASVYLDANENPRGNFNRYPDPYQSELRECIAQSWEVTQESVFIGNGSDEIIDLSFRIFCEPQKDKVLAFSPTYGMYQVSASINAVDVVTCPLDTNFDIDLDKATKALQDTSIKLVFVCSPNNPTGNTVSFSAVQKLLEAFNGIIIVDEAYIDFAQRPSFGKLVLEYPRLIVIRTLSKAWGLAGARIGIGLMNPEIRAWFDRIKPPYNVSSLNAKAAIETLENKSAFEKSKAEILSERALVQSELSQINGIEYIFPSEANFLLVRCINSNDLYNFLLDCGIVVRDRSQYVKDSLRITVGTKEENTRVIAAIAQFYAKNQLQ